MKVCHVAGAPAAACMWPCPLVGFLWPLAGPVGGSGESWPLVSVAGSRIGEAPALYVSELGEAWRGHLFWGVTENAESSPFSLRALR